MKNWKPEIDTWVEDGEWKIAPAGIPWIKESSRIRVADFLSLGEGTVVGNGCRFGEASIGFRVTIGNAASIGVQYKPASEEDQYITKIADRVKIGESVVIGHSVWLEADSEIGDRSVIIA